jgi:beta-N-acetylhexosaminidase
MAARCRVILAVVVVVAYALIALVGPLLVGRDGLAFDLARDLAPPSRDAWLGRAENGVDVVTALVFGARVSLWVALAATLVSTVVGVAVGSAAAIAGGRLDALALRILDVLQAFPGILLAVYLAAVLPPSTLTVVVALSATGWVGYARVARTSVQAMLAREHVAAARALGASGPRVVLRHVLPLIAGPIVIQASFGLSGAILAESSLAFLGLAAGHAVVGRAPRRGRRLSVRGAPPRDRAGNMHRDRGALLQHPRRRLARQIGCKVQGMNLGQLFLIGFDGKSVPQSARELLVKEGAGGVILFKRNIESLEQVVALNTEIFALGTGAVVSVDQEGGRVARLRGICTDVPPMRVIGSQDDDVAYKVGAMMGRELVALGFHWNFAPVVDVDTNPNNPVIGERSFSRDAAAVARIGARFIAGLQGAGVAGSAKHFPGHGDTDTDSHFALPRLPHSLERLEKVELVPFEAAAQAGVASVMTAHVMFPALDPDEPATLSEKILHGLLRKRIGYDGVVVSDDLEMAAVADRYGIEELVRRGLLAGVDAFLVCHDPDKQARAIAAAHQLVESGRVPKARVEQALARVAALKAKYVGAPAAPTLDEARAVVRCAPHLELAARLLDAGVAVEGRGQSPVDVA